MPKKSAVIPTKKPVVLVQPDSACAACGHHSGQAWPNHKRHGPNDQTEFGRQAASDNFLNYVRVNECVNNGHKTERGRLTIIGAQTSNGARTFAPVLPGIETQEDWDAHLAGIRSSLSPVGHLESELAYKVALALRQWHRLDRYERAATVQAMEEAAQEPIGGDEVQTVMEAGVQALKERSMLAGRLIELATACPIMELNAPIAPSDGRLLLCAAFTGELKKKANVEEPLFEEPPHWTWGAV